MAESVLAVRLRRTKPLKYFYINWTSREGVGVGIMLYNLGGEFLSVFLSDM